MKGSSYKNFYFMLLVSFVIMYSVMFLNVAKFEHIYLSTTRFYMAILMVAPMAIFMILMMGDMFKDKKKNKLIISLSIILFILVLVSLRTQTPIKDEQYIMAMIPHHSSAILTSREANLNDSEVQKLAEDIIETQEREISQMKEILERL